MRRRSRDQDGVDGGCDAASPLVYGFLSALSKITHTDEHRATPPRSSDRMITEHYWGYARQPGGGTVEYQVEHPRWRVWRASAAALECDARSLYGADFGHALSGQPSTAFLAEGSAVTVRQGRQLRSP